MNTENSELRFACMETGYQCKVCLYYPDCHYACGVIDCEVQVIDHRGRIVGYTWSKEVEDYMSKHNPHLKNMRS